MPPLTDFFALLGIDLVLGAGMLRLLARWPGVARWAAIGVMLLLWVPVGHAQLPVLGYVRGISSDLSVTLVVLALMGAWRQLRMPGMAPLFEDVREGNAVCWAIACAAVFLYPLALGWGDWDPYRVGWFAWLLLLALLVLSAGAWMRGLRLLPWLVALAILAWVGGLLESTNLWDYLIDPWIAISSLFRVARGITVFLWERLHRTTARSLGSRRHRSVAADVSPAAKTPRVS